RARAAGGESRGGATVGLREISGDLRTGKLEAGGAGVGEPYRLWDAQSPDLLRVEDQIAHAKRRLSRQGQFVGAHVDRAHAVVVAIENSGTARIVGLGQIGDRIGAGIDRG